MGAQDEEERAKAEAEAGEKGDDEDDEDLDDLMKMRRMRSRTETTRTQRVTTSYEVVRALFYQAFAGAVRGMVPASAGSYLCRILGTHQRVSGHSQVNFIQRLLV